MPLGAAGKPVEVWFADEARVGQKGTHAYIWAQIGDRPAMVRDNRHDSVHLFGAICPARGVGAAIIMPAVNTEAMNELRWPPEPGQVAKRESSLCSAIWPKVRHDEYTEETRC